MSSSTDALVPVGYVRRAHGLEGDVVIRPLTDHPDRFAPGNAFLTDETPPRRVEVAASRSHPDGVLLRLAGIEDRTAAERMQGTTLLIDRAQRRELDHDEYWPDDLHGLVVIDPLGRHLGKVTGVVLGAAQDRLVVATDDGRDVEVPFVDEIVGAIHPSGGHVVVDAPEGLF